MIGRQQLAVASPISAAALVGAFPASLANRESVVERARALVSERFGASGAILTDSGTSALVLALRLAARSTGVVGFPAFACVDLVAAAQLAGVRVRLYDLDPATLGPDLDSLERMLERGVDAVIIAHLYGFPADVPAVRERAARYGVAVIEDAAQGAGATLHGKRLGGFGDLSVLSFGRGKGLCAGQGGALLAAEPSWSGAVDAIDLPAPGLGWIGLAKTAAQWTLGRPSLYAIPSRIPWLHLGEMVYHPAHEPVCMPRGACALLPSAFALEAADLQGRRARAAALTRAATTVATAGVVAAIPGSVPSFLRYPVRDLTGRRGIAASIGVLRSYPVTMAQQPQLVPILIDGEVPVPGAEELRRSLFTLPTHRFVTDPDLAALASWLVEGRNLASGYAVPEARPGNVPTSSLDVTTPRLPR
ncbi:MAG: DegT/DnrJ/EryC1/StrS family aminotransferase [Gemmatimonadaceae bacterium]